MNADPRTLATDEEGDAILEALAEAYARLVDHTFPALTVETYTDPADSEDSHQGLACPRCGAQDIAPDSIAAVDMAERWTHASEAEDGVLKLWSDDSPQWGDTLYYLHNDRCHVSLPEGWTEGWN